MRKNSFVYLALIFFFFFMFLPSEMLTISINSFALSSLMYICFVHISQPLISCAYFPWLTCVCVCVCIRPLLYIPRCCLYRIAFIFIPIVIYYHQLGRKRLGLAVYPQTSMLYLKENPGVIIALYITGQKTHSSLDD